MYSRVSAFALVFFALSGLTAARNHASHNYLFGQQAFNPDTADANAGDDPLPYSTRTHWMQVASSANHAISPCPFAPFGTAIVNHTTSFLDTSNKGSLICTGVNHNGLTGNPTLHGEMAAFQNCSNILTDPDGAYKLSSSEALEAWKHFSLYTTAEPCPMCASAVAWAGIKEVIFGSSVEGLIELGWSQIEIGSVEVLERAWRLGRSTRVLGGMLGDEMDGWFGWQFAGGECPVGCERGEEGGRCGPVDSEQFSGKIG